jgi:hypothetical protein
VLPQKTCSSEHGEYQDTLVVMIHSTIKVVALTVVWIGTKPDRDTGAE